MLSIRTQNRMVLVPYRDAIQIDGIGNKWRIYTVYTEYNLLGKYKTKERCLEILDEIERYVLGKTFVQTTKYEKRDYLEYSTSPYVEINENKLEDLPAVYHMPKE